MEAKSSGPSCSGLNLVAHPRAKSKVWKYFGFDTNADGCILSWKRIYCRVCFNPIPYSGNTSNLTYHLEKNHPVEFGEFVKSNTDQVREVFSTTLGSSHCVPSKVKTEPSSQLGQPPLQETSLKQGLDSEKRRHNDLTTAILNFISEGLYPVSVVEEPTFKALMSTIDSGYSLPSKSELAMKMLPQLYCCMHDMVFKDVAEVVTCGVTMDLWQSQTQKRTYISLSLQSLNHNTSSGFSLTNKCLKTFEVQEENTAESITREMYEAFVKWGITHKVTGATTNGSVDIIKACSLLELSVKMPCLGHTINRAMGEAFQLPSIENFLRCCRRLVDDFKEPAMFLLREKQLAQTQPSALLSDRGSSWCATLAMLKRLKEQRAAVVGALKESSGSHRLSPDGLDWVLLEGLIGVLQPFKVVADMITSCRYPIISMVQPVLHMLINTTLKVKEEDPDEISLAKDVISKVLLGTYTGSSSHEISMFLKAATFLDPRYKKLPFLSAQERAKVEEHVLEDAKAILEKQNAEHLYDGDLSLDEEPPSKKSLLSSNSTQENPLAALFCQFNADQSMEELHAQVVEELSNYKSQRVLGLNEDPLVWWSSHAPLFPTLPKVLQKYWCVAATSVPCHRLFGSSGAVLCGKRNQIAPALVDQQVFLYENSRSYYEPEPGDYDLESI